MVTDSLPYSYLKIHEISFSCQVNNEGKGKGRSKFLLFFDSPFDI